MKDQITAFFTAQKEIFHHYLEAVTISENEEEIHQLRLSVKRMRALLAFLSFVNGEKVGKPYTHELRKVYVPAGKLRDLQVQLIHLNKYERRLNLSCGAYEAYLKNIAANTVQELQARAGAYDPKNTDALEKRVQQITSAFTDEELSQRLNTILQQRFEQVKLLRNAPENNRKNMHGLRKTLKEIRYFLEVFEQPLMELNEFNVKYYRLKQMEKVLGLWHDQVNGRRYLKDFIKTLHQAGRLEALKHKILLQGIRSYERLLKQRMLLTFDFELHTAE